MRPEIELALSRLMFYYHMQFLSLTSILTCTTALGLYYSVLCLRKTSGHFVKKLVSNNSFVSTYVWYYLTYILTLFQKNFYTIGIQSKKSKPDSRDLKSKPWLLLFRSGYAIQLNKNTQQRLCSAGLTHPLTFFSAAQSLSSGGGTAAHVSTYPLTCAQQNRSCSLSVHASEAHSAGPWSTSLKSLVSHLSHMH